MAETSITQPAPTGQPQKPIYIQITGIDRDPKTFRFGIPLCFGNNCHLQIDRFGCPVIISGNRWELANQLESIARTLRGDL